MTNIGSGPADKQNFGEISPKFFDISNTAPFKYGLSLEYYSSNEKEVSPSFQNCFSQRFYPEGEAMVSSSLLSAVARRYVNRIVPFCE